jgi:hypothetical protein
MTTKIRRLTIDDCLAESDFRNAGVEPFECQRECRCPWLAAYPNDLCGDCDEGRHKIWGTNFPRRMPSRRARWAWLSAAD